MSDYRLETEDTQHPNYEKLSNLEQKLCTFMLNLFDSDIMVMRAAMPKGPYCMNVNQWFQQNHT